MTFLALIKTQGVSLSRNFCPVHETFDFTTCIAGVFILLYTRYIKTNLRPG